MDNSIGRMYKKYLDDVIDADSQITTNYCLQYDYMRIAKVFASYVRALPVLTVTNQPVTPVIFWSWLQGENNAPEICKACLKSLRRSYSDIDIIIVTEANLERFISLPSYYWDKYRQGMICNAHFSDVIRTYLLAQYGGAWIDATVFASKSVRDLFSEPFFLYKNIMRGTNAVSGDNWLMVANQHHPIMEDMIKLLDLFWKYNDATDDYFLYHHFLTLLSDKYKLLWDAIPTFSNVPPHIMQLELHAPYNGKRFQQLVDMSAFHKLTYKVKKTDLGSVTNYDYIISL